MQIAAPAAASRLRAAALADPAPLVLAAALPFLFLHRNYAPSVSLPHGVDVLLGDVAVLVVAGFALVAGLRAGFAPLRSGALLAMVALLGWIALSVAYGAAREDWYPAQTHGITAAKFAEYGLLALSVPLIARRARQLWPAAIVLVGWSCVATIVGALQFFGVLGDLDQTPPGRRKPSFLGYHDFATLSAFALVVAAVALIFVPRSRGRDRLVAAGGVAGTLGVILGGPLDGALGLLLALVALLGVGRAVGRMPLRRALAFAGVWVVVLAGIVAMRGSTITEGLRLVGIREHTAQSLRESRENTQSYAQRELLAYVGLRIWWREPLLGVGWLGSVDEPAYAPELPAARKRFDQPAEAFPSSEHPWGVQNAYVEALADLGIPGLLAFVGVFATAVVVGVRRARRAPPEVAAVALAGAAGALVCVAMWNGYGFTAGIPLDAATWLAVGAVAAGARR